MNSNMTPDQLMNSVKETQTAMVEMVAKTIECMEKHLDLNLKAARANLADATEASSQLMSVKDVPEFYATVQSVSQPALGKSTSYTRNVYNINAETALSLPKWLRFAWQKSTKQCQQALTKCPRPHPQVLRAWWPW